MRAHPLSSLGLAILLATSMSCSSSSSSRPTSGSATLSVHLVDGPGDFLEVNLHVLKVEIENDATGWTTLGTPDKTIDLLTLTGGVEATLVNGASLPAGSYGQLRLLLGSGNTVKLLDGTVADLKVPSGLQSGLKLPVHFDVQPDTTKDVFIDFDAHRSIFVHGAGKSGQYILRPVVRAVDQVVTGAITGKLTAAPVDSTAATPLPGVAVTAQVLDAGGNASIVRTATTGGDGSYTLDLLPVGASYYVVGQPAIGGTVYVARASGPIAITAAAPVADYDATFDATTAIGGVTGKITPTATADDADTVVLEQALDAGGAPQTFILRTGDATVTGTTESYAFDGLPAGGYALSVERRTMDATGLETVKTSPAVSAAVTAGATVTADLALP
jgi:hypothetical protein